jgi:hypothetical protein
VVFKALKMTLLIEEQAAFIVDALDGRALRLGQRDITQKKLFETTQTATCTRTKLTSK